MREEEEEEEKVYCHLIVFNPSKQQQQIRLILHWLQKKNKEKNSQRMIIFEYPIQSRYSGDEWS